MALVPLLGSATVPILQNVKKMAAECGSSQ